MNKKVFIFGFGFTSAYFAKLLTKQQYQVVSTSRNIDSKQKYISKLNIDNKYIKLLDFEDNSNIESEMVNADSVLISIAPDKLSNNIDPVLDKYIKLILDNKSHIKWLGYLSSTGVYGDHKGDWVNEQSKCLANSNSAKKRLQAETKWLDLYKSYNIPTHIFRLAGIYGPGRSIIERLNSGKDFSVYKPEHMFSRIHVEDIANILYTSMRHTTPGEIYNICDDMPAPSHEIDTFAAGLLGLNKLKFVDFKQADLSPMAMEFYSHNKKVSNKKLKNKLNYKFIYPNYMLGLKSIIDSDTV